MDAQRDRLTGRPGRNAAGGGSVAAAAGGITTPPPTSIERAIYDAVPGLPDFYDSVPAYTSRRDVGFYVAEAVNAGGAVLELGCGTGRILLPIARKGLTIDGLDSSRSMLDRCRSKLTDEDAPVRNRVKLHEGDVRDFDLGKKFSLVIAPFRVVQHLVTISDQLSFLDSVGRHLGAGGRLVFDVFNPDFAALTSAGDGVEREDTPETALPDGRTFRRAVRVNKVRWTEQVSEIELIYYVSDRRRGKNERYVHSFDMRWYLRAEIEHLLARGGFRVVEILGNLDRGPLTDKSPEMVVRAELE